MPNLTFISERLKTIKPSPSIAANELVTTLRAEGKDIVNFTIGEPDFDTPEHIIQAAIAALKTAKRTTLPPPALVALRKAVQKNWRGITA